MWYSSALEYARIMPSTASLLSFYASFSTSLMLLRNAYREIVPKWLETYVITTLGRFFNRTLPSPSYNTFIIDDSWDSFGRNKLIEAATMYLSPKIGPNNKIIRVGMFKQENMTTALVDGQKIVDVFEDIEITWRFVKPVKKQDDDQRSGKQYFEVMFEDKYWDKVLNEYLTQVVTTYKALTEAEPILQLYSWKSGIRWRSVDFEHPSTFDTLAIDYELKKSIKDDLDSFLARKDFYKRVGKAWKRGYLLYGPPGTGKSSLIAAMANYLNFNIYNLELEKIHSDSDLREAMLYTDSKSIIVVEDIDCIPEVHHRSNVENLKKFSLSTLLNCIDGLWSIHGEERIIVFTTNRKEVLDPALLRPGRIDKQIHMSYCTTEAFRILASNYLDIQCHQLFEEIDGLLQSTEVTPASLAEELMKSDDADVALGKVVNFLRQKKIEKEMEKEKIEEEKENETH